MICTGGKVGTPNEKLAEVTEHEFKEFVELSQSYIRDTIAFISKLREIKEPRPENALLFWFDVKVYPSVPWKEGLGTCKEAEESRPTSLVDTESVMQMIGTVRDNNIYLSFVTKTVSRKKVWQLTSLKGRIKLVSTKK